MKKTELEENAIHLLADLLFAYINKDEESPHIFEVETVQKVVDLLKKEYDGTKYNKEFFKRCQDHVKRSIENDK